MTTHRSPGRGFTLIELMVVVAIVGIVSAIAYPAYTGSVLKGKRAEGRSALAELMLNQERYQTQTGSYMTFAVGATGANGTTAAGSGKTIPFKAYSGNSSTSPYYLLGGTACPGGESLKECVRVFARPQVTDALAGDLRITSSGVKDCTGTDTTVCWK